MAAFLLVGVTRMRESDVPVEGLLDSSDGETEETVTPGTPNSAVSAEVVLDIVRRANRSRQNDYTADNLWSGPQVC